MILIEKLWLAHDIRRVLNPLLVAGQVEGSAYMGYAEALMEQQVFRKGRHKFPSLLDYKIPTTLDTPEIETILVEEPDLEGPFGAKEAGQGPLIPVPPAIINAVFNAVGLRIDEIPITPDKVLKALKQAVQGRPAAVKPLEPLPTWPTRLIAEHRERAILVAGGTDLYPNMKRRQFTPELLVGLRRLRELRGISGDPGGGIRVGAFGKAS